MYTKEMIMKDTINETELENFLSNIWTSKDNRFDNEYFLIDMVKMGLINMAKGFVYQSFFDSPEDEKHYLQIIESNVEPQNC